MKDFTHPFFDEVYSFKTLSSTFEKTKKMIRDETDNGNFLVICDQQTGGIGRNDNYWFSPAGGIWMTAALYTLPFRSGFTLFSGLCILKALRSYFLAGKKEEEAKYLTIKWPNDIYWKDQKLCGLLTTYLDQYKYHIIGIGLNTNNPIPEVLVPQAVSLKEVFKREVLNEDLLKLIFDNFSSDLPFFLESGLDVDFFLKNSYLKGKKVIVNTDFDKFSGEVKGINRNGALQLRLTSGMIQPFYSGSVELIED